MSSIDLSPVRLSYVAALRGVMPRKPLSSFTYAQMGTFEAESLLCLAASNPEGRFFGILPDNAVARACELAKARRVLNVVFGTGPNILPEKLNFLCCESLTKQLTPQERETFFDLAETRLAPGGLLAYRYKAYANADDTLRFLIQEYAPELSASQAQEFLSELKNLGPLYFADHPIALTALNKAIDAKNPDAFFESCLGDNPATSGTFQTMEGLLPRGFAPAGDANIGANYMELAAPAASHETLTVCRGHILYEPIKDFVLQRLTRNDVWVKLPVEQTTQKPSLFGQFVFGITTPREQVPAQMAMNGNVLDFSTPLFSNLIDLMCFLPLGVGDFLQHPSGKGFDADDVLAAIQILVATGIARPVRERYEGKDAASTTANPKWASAFNATLMESEITQPVVHLASPIVGGALSLSAREALVLQALGRVGLSNISGSLQPELKQIILNNPSLAAQVMDAATPTDEVVHTLVTSVLEKGMVRWYAYGLLAA